MIGVFDSGIGGLTALAELRRLMPHSDICYLADREHAPYGTKSERELLRLVRSDVARLAAEGAEAILMACCTASTVYPLLSEEERSLCLPIIAPAVGAALRATESGSIAAIATERTVAAHAFRREAERRNEGVHVSEYAVQGLVALVESGARDGHVGASGRRRLAELLSSAKSGNFDTLILGCTHFPHLKNEIARVFPAVKIIDPSVEGARELARLAGAGGIGRTIYL